MRVTKTNLLLLLLLMAAIGGFWWLQPTSPERLSSLAFFILVALYALLAHRSDVLSAGICFFVIADTNRYLAYGTLPIGTMALVFSSSTALIWLVLFGRRGWFLAIAAALAVIEAGFALQYINLDANTQALLIASPFILVCQHYYFQRYHLA